MNLPEKMGGAYDSFYDAMTEDDILDGRTRTLVRLAASMALGCGS